MRKIQAQGLGENNPDPYKRVSPFGSASESISEAFSPNVTQPQTGIPGMLKAAPLGIPQSIENQNSVFGRSEQSSLGDVTLSRLPSRSEMNRHYLDGEGESITVPIEYLPIDELDWTKASKDLIRSTWSGGQDYVSGVVHVSFSGTNAYGVLGQMNFDLAGTMEAYEDGTYDFDGGVDASSGGELYDFDMHSWTKEPLRNLATLAGKPKWDRDKSTEPQPFFINIPGTHQVRFSGKL